MELLEIFTSDQAFFSFFIKTFGVVLSFLYIVFSTVVLKQISILKKTVGFNDKGFLTTAALVQLFLGGAMFLYSLLLL